MPQFRSCRAFLAEAPDVVRMTHMPDGAFAWSIRRYGDVACTTLSVMLPIDTSRLPAHMRDDGWLRMATVPVHLRRKRLDKQWQWNGDTRKPTLSPSISYRIGDKPADVEVWHGFLVDGILRSV